MEMNDLYYFIYFLDSDFKPGPKETFIELYPAGYLVLGEGHWPQNGLHSKVNAFFTIEEARNALRKIEDTLNSQNE